MRTIKFRAWDDGKKEWLLGYNYPNLGGFDMFGECILMDEWAKVATSFMFGRNGKKLSDLKLMQFTGLKDKNEKEIYEGDIVNFGNNNNQEVVFDNGCFNVFDEPLGWDFDSEFKPIKTDLKYCEVIGNIFENPKLIKK